MSTIIDFSLDGTLKSTITNDGNLPTKATITVSFFDSASYIEITSSTTSDKLRFDHSFIAGDSLTIDCDAQYASLNGASNSAMQYLDLTSRFFNVAVGDNIYTIAPQRVAYLIIQFTERWR